MTLERRAFLQVAGLTAAVMSAGACSPLDRWGATRASGGLGSLAAGERAILDRLSYGASARITERVAGIGVASWIEEQLAADPIDELGMRWRLRNLEALEKQADELESHKRSQLLAQLRQGALLRRVYSERQLYEMMVEFWSDHFNISVEKGNCWFLKVVDDRNVIRAHALGNFKDLLHGSARSPAMLVYLDNQANRRGAPNENYARELLELHTLGVDGGYSQQDIFELARSLTGWTVKEHFWLGQFEFDPDLHDQGKKQLLGITLDQHGEGEVPQILEYLASHPSTARHIAEKLVTRFVCDDPAAQAPELLLRTQQAFLRSGGDIRTTLRSLLLDGLHRNPELQGVKFKRPVDYMASALRMTGSETDGGEALHPFLARMGQPLFAWPTPDGPPDVATAWQANLSPRWTFALRLASGELEGTSVPVEPWLDLAASNSLAGAIRIAAENILGARISGSQVTELVNKIPKIPGLGEEDNLRAVLAGLIASPAFQYR